MNWREAELAPDRSHHRVAGRPLYEARFDEALSFHPPGLAAVRVGDRGWHIQADGGEAYSRRFRRSFGHYEGLAAVVSEDGWHHIDVHGNDAYVNRYAWCGNFQGGRCAARTADAAYLHIDARGVPAYDRRWRYAGDFRQGWAVVQGDEGRSTHIDVQGAPVHGRWFLDLDVFHKGFARARDEAGWTHVGPDGRPAYVRRFAMVEPFYNGQARVERFDGGLEIIAEGGASIVELRPAKPDRVRAVVLASLELEALKGRALSLLDGPIGHWEQPVFLAGGWFTGPALGEAPRDLDLFFPDRDALEACAQRILSRGGRLLDDRRPFYRRLEHGGQVLELAYNVWCERLEELFECFDLGPSMVGARICDGRAQAEVHPLALRSAASGVVLFNPAHPNRKYALVSLARAHRYAGRLAMRVDEEGASQLWSVFSDAEPAEQRKMLERFEGVGLRDDDLAARARAIVGARS